MKATKLRVRKLVALDDKLVQQRLRLQLIAEGEDVVPSKGRRGTRRGTRRRRRTRGGRWKRRRVKRAV